ncbi:hypothetical protein MAPG_00971 [Magnaporthiopsis poae ATCC 64411]|uniref:Uncharacterized protein n=1 Tax=Magnaporthiopsis poae (strain ATCC 64411 / 73-15) TaxID=644358 RepID=A0A0C4DMG4_MAGP6|nr:hypothetical protein MAPG_00971 [Magnaporthiopsis poae ATCC 64411]
MNACRYMPSQSLHIRLLRPRGCGCMYQSLANKRRNQSATEAQVPTCRRDGNTRKLQVLSRHAGRREKRPEKAVAEHHTACTYMYPYSEPSAAYTQLSNDPKTVRSVFSDSPPHVSLYRLFLAHGWRLEGPMNNKKRILTRKISRARYAT